MGKTPTDKTACEDPDLAQCSVEVVDEAVQQRFINPDLGGIGQQVNGAGIADLANTRVRE